MNFFRNQDINQKLAAIWGAFTQEKQLSEKRELCGVLTFPTFYYLAP